MNIDAARFRRAEVLFHAARALPTERREAFMRAECGDDTELHDQVAVLLAAADAQGPGPATNLLERAGSESIAADAHAQNGRVIGAWRLLRPLGTGGMGSVFLVERSDGAFRTHAALKMLNPWLRGSSSLERRFTLERQILSDLKHPSIAALLDGGVTDDGVPYLVMQYVEGVSITDFARIHNLDIERRLQLLLPVCRAVQHAHQNLVIHRDLKPGNILVTSEGDPKLLDFGIAKLLLSVDVRDAGANDAQTRLLTPQYASPEQLQNRAVTTASDVYSLGVILHELLTGMRPVHESADASAPPTRPSSAMLRAASSDIELPDAESRARWSQRLRGDLDTLVLKALASEPERRYATAAQLGDDIERYLQNKPLLARPDSLRYRAAKFVRRHRAAVALGAAALILIVGAAILLAVLAVRLRDERDRAEREAHTAQRVSGFLESLFDGANPNQTQGAAPTLRDVLDRGARDVGEKLKDDPVVQARLFVLIADAYRQLEELAKGIAVAEKAVALRRTRAILEPSALAESLDSLGELRRRNAEYVEAEKLHREALALRRALLPADPMMVGRSLNNLALTLSEAGRAEESLPLYEESLALRRRALGDDAAPVLTTLVNIGLLRGANGDLAGAQAAFSEVYEKRRKAFGENHVATANVMTHLGHTLTSLGKADESEALLRRSLAVRRELIGPRSPAVSISLYELARALQYRGDLDQAEALLREAHAIDLEVFGPDHAETAPAAGLLGDVLLAKGDAVAAETMLADALRICRLRLRADHPRLAAAQSHLADALVTMRRYDEAETAYNNALTIQRKKLRAGNSEIAHTLLGLADVAQHRSDFAAAWGFIDEASPILADSVADVEPLRRRLAALRASLPALDGKRTASPRP